MQKIIIGAFALLVILALLVWRFGPSGPRIAGPITLTYWGFEEENVIKPIVEGYIKDRPGIIINYVKQPPLNYRTRVQTQVREGVGPDVFRIHNSWTEVFLTDLYPAPTNIFNAVEYQNTFYPVAYDSFIRDQQILAVPIQTDGLALFYNEEILAGVGVNPPKSWNELIEAATKVTVRDSSGKIKTGGAPLGAVSNVDHFSDILGLLLVQQPGVNFKNLNTAETVEVLKFYTGFILDPKKKTWDVDLTPSTQMFASGNLAFYFGPSSRVIEIKQLNPNLKFKVVPVPQLPGKQVSWGSFWGEAVSIKSKYPNESWEFVKYLSSAPAQRIRGGVPSRKDLAEQLASDPQLGAYVAQGPNYKSWYLNSNTLDNGLNDEMIKIWGDGVLAILAGQDPAVTLQNIDRGVKQTLDRYTKPVAPR